MTKMSQTWQLAAMAGLIMVCWAAVHATTFGYPIFWDDLHFIRAYSLEELLATFHGPNDPDRNETMGLRPFATLLFSLQWSMFGENVVLHRIFMAVLMGGLLWAVGLLLREAGLSLRHVAVVLVLFASSRVFASLMLWLTLGSLILSYIFMILTALYYLRGVNGERSADLALAFLFAALAIFTREEPYTLPVVLPLLWCISAPSRTNWRRAVGAAAGIALIMAVHFILRKYFVPEAPPIVLSLSGADQLLQSALSAWMPAGYDVVGRGDRLISLLWTAFLGLLLLIFARIGSTRSVAQFCGICLIGVILCAPALGVPRSFGIAMPALAFFTAISLAIFEIYKRIPSVPLGGRLWRPAVLSMLLLGVAWGAGGGLLRSMYVAESLHENSARMLIRNGMFLLDMYPNPATVPAARRDAGRARLAALGIRTREDVQRLRRMVDEKSEQLIRNRESRSAPFLEKYDYMSF
jgi:hypothetical protein